MTVKSAMSEDIHKLLRHSGRVNGVREVAYLGLCPPVRAGQRDRLTASIRKFIEGAEPHVSRWIGFAAPRIVEELSFDLIVRALRHHEVAANGGSPLDKLCDAIAVASGKPYVPHRIWKKHATRSLRELEGKPARAAAINGVLRFDNSSIMDNARILIVDSIFWTGATAEAMARAIHEKLPQAEVVAFALVRADGSATNNRLNPGYFEGTSDDPFVAPPLPGREPPRAKQAAEGRAIPAGAAPRISNPDPASGKPGPPERPGPSVSMRQPGEVPAPETFPASGAQSEPPPAQPLASGSAHGPLLLPGPAPASTPAPEQPRTLGQPAGSQPAVAPAPASDPGSGSVAVSGSPPAKARRIMTSSLLLGGLALVVLIVGTLVPLRSGKKPVSEPDPLSEPLELFPPEDAGASLSAEKPVVTPEPAYPQGVIAVPDAGLRQSASLDARMVSRAKLRNGEQVSIVKRHKPDVGPAWLQVKTRSGKVGWVFASVVNEKKSRHR